MNRRGHLSNKVPNVKLRPVSSAAPRKQREASPRNAMDQEMLNRAWANADDEEVSSMALRSTRKPWEQVVITFTGIDDKPRLAELAKQLGATVESALTRDVTHVVAMGFGSPKYLYAVEHRIPVMLPLWIEEAHKRWIAAEEVDVVESMEGHRLLAFTGLTISVTGVEELGKRKDMIKYISSNGGKYLKDLDRSATHLVTAQPTNIRAPSAKVKWAVEQLVLAEGQRRAGKRTEKEDIKIVYEDWIWDCVGYEGRWKEDWYDARKVRRAARLKLGYDDVRSGDAKTKMLQAVKVEPTVKEEPAVLKKRKRDAMDNLVGELISTAGVPSAGSRDIKPTRTELSEAMDVDTGLAPRRSAAQLVPDRKPSILHNSRTNSFAGSSKLTREVPLEAASTSSIPASISAAKPVDAAPADADESYPQPIFAGMRFTPVMSDDSSTLEAALKAHAGEIVSETSWREGESTDYIIVRFRPTSRYASLRLDFDSIPEDERPPVVTECWIEGCCYEQRVLPLDQHIVFRPLVGSFPIYGAEKLSVHLSGFSSEISVYLKRLIKALGLTVSEKLNRQTSHLVCGSPAGQKYIKALEWRVSVVKDTWLIAMGRSARIEPDDRHRHEAGPEILGANGAASTAVSRASSATVGASRPALERTKTDVDPSGEDAHMRSDQTSLRGISGVMNIQPVPESSPSMPSMRKLKLTPTHVDQMIADDVGPTTARTSSLPLSPPTLETERLLNKANILPGRRNHSEPEAGSQGKAKAQIQSESIESKLSRTSSAPVPQASLQRDGRTSVDPRSTSLSTLGRPEMSEMLKLLAQPGSAAGGDSASSANMTMGNRTFKPIRRPRPSASSAGGGASKLRTSVAYASPNHGAEGFDTTADTTADTTLRFSNSPPPTSSRPGREGHDIDMSGNQSALDHGFDESVRVNYVDPVAEKERRRIMEAMRKAALAANRAAARGEAGVSPAKKRRA